MLREPKPMNLRVRRLWRFSWTQRYLRLGQVGNQREANDGTSRQAPRPRQEGRRGRDGRLLDAPRGCGAGTRGRRRRTCGPARGNGAGTAPAGRRGSHRARKHVTPGRTESPRLRPTSSLPFVGPMADVVLILLLAAGLATALVWLARVL